MNEYDQPMSKQSTVVLFYEQHGIFALFECSMDIEMTNLPLAYLVRAPPRDKLSSPDNK